MADKSKPKFIDLLTLHINKDEKSTSMISKFNLKSAQIFTSGRISYKINSDANDKLRGMVDRLWVHAPYVANPWTSTKSTNGLLAQMDECARLNALGCVIHLGKKSLDVVVPTICEHKWKVPLLIEPTAIRPNKMPSYETPEKLNALVEAIAEAKKCKPDQILKKHNIGLCLDTAHIFISQQDIKSYDSTIEWLGRFKYKKVIGLIHINGADNFDPKKKQLTCKDKHNTPFFGYKDDVIHKDQIWGGIKWNKSGCKAFFELAQELNIDLIREQNRGTQKDFAKFHRLITRLSSE